MSTYRERRLAKADRLDGWAEKREAKAEEAAARARQMGEGIPFGQPILVGHHSERRDRAYRDRISRTQERAHEDAQKAQEMSSRAAGIRAAAEGAIYSDDEDAVERLQERIAELEAQRDRIKAYNASCRKGSPDTSLLDEAQRRSLLSVLRHSPYQSKGGAMPAYALTNLSGNIARQRKRLQELTR